MKVICLSRDGAHRVAFSLKPFTHVGLPVSLILLLITGLTVNQFVTASQASKETIQAPVALTPLEADKIITALGQQINAVENIRKAYANYTVDVDTLSARLGELEAETARLNALAKRVIKRAKLDPAEFELDRAPPRGGLDEDYMPADAPRVSNEELLSAFDQAELQLNRHRSLLEGLHHILEGLALEEEVLPSFRPVDKGYISSRFGPRRDPFNGRMRAHRGLDFAGPIGSAIYSVAGGVVSFTGWRGGYGNVVEVDHGSGFVSRYAHLHDVLVENGSVVTKGSRIALMGSTGRSTGSHLHLEILQDGKQVDPEHYLQNLE